MRPTEALRRLACLLLALLGPWLTGTGPARAADGLDGPAPRIGVITMGSGTEYWSRFGHNAILVQDPRSGQATSYNYGYFDFDQPGFMARFLRGEMQYRLVALPLAQDLQLYALEQRSALLQWLDLEPEQARAARDFLAWNARPENAEYRYDYFTDNCSTRVRDVLDRVLGGALSRQWSGSLGDLTYRSEALRLGADVPWLYLGMHAGLGPAADRPLTTWEEGFVPGHLAAALEQAGTASGRPLVMARELLLPDRLQIERAATPQRRTGFVATGILLAVLLLTLLRRRAGRAARTAGTILAGSIWLTCGLGGLLLLALWGLTEHRAAWANANLLLLNPLCLGLLAVVPAWLRDRPTRPWLRALAGLVLAASLLAGLLHLLPHWLQDNGDFIALLLPVHAVLAWQLLRGRARSTDIPPARA